MAKSHDMAHLNLVMLKQFNKKYMPFISFYTES